MATEQNPDPVKVIGPVEIKKGDEVPDAKPTAQTTTKTEKTEVLTGAPPPPPPPPIVADDWIRKALAVGTVLQFTIYIVVITYLIVYLGKELSNTANNIIMIILTAEIGYMGMCYNYYMGSSSGSTQKSALLEKK